ncbi:MAG: phosphoglycolate phosphatase [Rhizobiales bacterium]|nr:phosphoglycolate phosphatase [Hyphomicrobiales bacterium]
MTSSSRGTLIFDLDGTLVDSAGDIAGSLDTLMSERGFAPFGLEQGRKLIGHGIANLVKGALRQRGVADVEALAPELIVRFTEIYGARLTRITRPYEGVAETLATLQSDGWRMGVCTNKREVFARQIVADLNLSRYFAFVCGPDTFNVSKPDPRQLLETARAVNGGDPLVFVGDSEVDVETARSAGCPVIAMAYGYTKKPLAELAPDAIAHSFAEIPAALRRIPALA